MFEPLQNFHFVFGIHIETRIIVTIPVNQNISLENTPLSSHKDHCFYSFIKRVNIFVLVKEKDHTEPSDLLVPDSRRISDCS